MGLKPGRCWGLVLAALLFCTPALGQTAAAAQPLPHHQAPAISFRGGATINVADKKRAADTNAADILSANTNSYQETQKDIDATQHATTTVKAQPPVAAHFAAAKAASNDADKKRAAAFVTTNAAKAASNEKRAAAFATTIAAKGAKSTSTSSHQEARKAAPMPVTATDIDATQHATTTVKAQPPVAAHFAAAKAASNDADKKGTTTFADSNAAAFQATSSYEEFRKDIDAAVGAQHATTTIKAQPPVAAYLAASETASDDPEEDSIVFINVATAQAEAQHANAVDAPGFVVAKATVSASDDTHQADAHADAQQATKVLTITAVAASNNAHQVESRLFENAIGRLGQLRRSAASTLAKFKAKAKKEMKSELKSQGKEAAEDQLAGLIDGMSMDEFANHLCVREGWDGYCPGPLLPPNVQTGPGDRCDCTPGHCWEWTGKKDPWYAHGWECTKQKGNMKNWVTAHANQEDAAKSQSGATQSPPGNGEGSNKYEEDWEWQTQAIQAGVGGITFIICICLVCYCLRSRKKSAEQSVEQMVNQRMAEQIVNQRMAQHTQQAPFAQQPPPPSVWSPSPSAVPQPVTAPMPISAAMPNAQGLCEGCGTVKTARFCGSCGRDNGPLLPVSPPMPAPQEFCPGCGTVKTARFCGSCGRDDGPMPSLTAGVGAAAPVPNKPMMAAAALGVGAAASGAAVYAGGEASAPTESKIAKMYSVLEKAKVAATEKAGEMTAALGVGAAASGAAGDAGGEASAPTESKIAKASSVLEKAKVAATEKAGEMTGSKLGQMVGGMIFGNDEDED